MPDARDDADEMVVGETGSTTTVVIRDKPMIEGHRFAVAYGPDVVKLNATYVLRVSNRSEGGTMERTYGRSLSPDEAEELAAHLREGARLARQMKAGG